MEKQRKQRVVLTDEQRALVLVAYKKGEPTTKIAERLGVSFSVTVKLVRAAGIVRPLKRLSNEQKQRISADYASGMSTPQLCKKYNIGPSAVVKVAKATGVVRARIITPAELIPQLIEAYKGGLTSYEVAEQFGVSNVTVQKYAKEAGCIRSGEYKIRRNAEIANDYRSGLSSTQIAKKFGVGPSAVQAVTRQAGITRPKSAVDPETKVRILLALDKGLSEEQAASEAGVDLLAVDRVKFYAAKPARIGSSAPGWQGGRHKLSSAIRGLEKYTYWRMSVFIRDKNTCQHCGTKGHKKGNPLQADHIYPFSALLQKHKIKSTDQAINCPELWDTNNGRTLCKSCHEKTDTYLNGARKYLTK